LLNSVAYCANQNVLSINDFIEVTPSQAQLSSITSPLIIEMNSSQDARYPSTGSQKQCN